MNMELFLIRSRRLKISHMIEFERFLEFSFSTIDQSIHSNAFVSMTFCKLESIALSLLSLSLIYNIMNKRRGEKHANVNTHPQKKNEKVHKISRIERTRMKRETKTDPSERFFTTNKRFAAKMNAFSLFLHANNRCSYVYIFIYNSDTE